MGDETPDDTAREPDESAESTAADSEAGVSDESDADEFDAPTESDDGTDTDAPVIDESTVPRIEEVECRNCGAPIASDATTCPECSAEQSPETEPSAATEQTTRSQQTTATSQAGQTEQSGKDVEPLFSAILSFFLPGVGQIYHGQSERGIVVFAGWIGWWLLLGLLFLLVTVVTLGLGIVTIIFLPVVDLLYHVVAAADAYVQGEKIASGEKQV